MKEAHSKLYGKGTCRLRAAFSVFLQCQKKRKGNTFPIHSFSSDGMGCRPNTGIAFISNYIFLKSKPQNLKKNMMENTSPKRIHRWQISR